MEQCGTMWNKCRSTWASQQCFNSQVSSACPSSCCQIGMSNCPRGPKSSRIFLPKSHSCRPPALQPPRPSSHLGKVVLCIRQEILTAISGFPAKTVTSNQSKANQNRRNQWMMTSSCKFSAKTYLMPVQSQTTQQSSTLFFNQL